MNMKRYVAQNLITNSLQSRRLFQSLMVQHTHVFTSMEHYISVLWHLNDTAQIASIAKRWATDISSLRLSFIAHGSLLSLKGLREDAISVFERSSFLDSRSMHSQLLIANEHLALDEFDAAEQNFAQIPESSKFYSKAQYVVYQETAELIE